MMRKGMKKDWEGSEMRIDKFKFKKVVKYD